MIDPELKKHLEILESELGKIPKKAPSLRNTFWNGMVYGAGYVIGAAFIVIIVGWILNIVGVIPAFSNYVSEFQSALERFNSR